METQDPNQKLRAVKSSPPTVEAVRRLLRSAAEVTGHDKDLALRLAREGRRLAEELFYSTRSSRASIRLLAEAHARQAEVHLRRGDLLEAQVEADTAAGLLEDDQLSESSLEVLQAQMRLAWSTDRAGLALRLSGEYLRLARRLGRRAKVVRGLAERARVLIEACQRPDAGLCCLLAISKADLALCADRELYAIVHNELLALIECELNAAASSRMARLLALAEAFGSPEDLLRLEWLQGRLDAGELRLDRAEARFRDLKRRMFEGGMLQEGGTVAVELAAVRLQLGDRTGAYEAVSEALPLLQPFSGTDFLAAYLVAYRSVLEGTLTEAFRVALRSLRRMQ